MSAKILGFNTGKPLGPGARPTEPDPATVQLLEDVLQAARAGEVQALVITYLTSNDCIGTGWSNPEYSIYRLVGALEVMKAKILHTFDEELAGG